MKKLVSLLSGALLVNVTIANPLPTVIAKVNTTDRYGAYQAITLTRSNLNTQFFLSGLWSNAIKVTTKDAYGRSLTKNGVSACSLHKNSNKRVKFPAGQYQCNLWFMPNTKNLKGVGSQYTSVHVYEGNGEYPKVKREIGIFDIDYGQALYAAGDFTKNTNTTTHKTSKLKYVAKYTGNAWQTLNTNFIPSKDKKHVHVNAMLVDHNGDIYVGGAFDTPNGGSSISYFNGSMWNGLNDQSLRFKGSINALALSKNNTLFAAGDLRGMPHNAPILTYAAADSPKLGYIGTNIRSGQIHTLLAANEKLYIGGDFTSKYGGYITEIDISKYHPSLQSREVVQWEPIDGLKLGPGKVNALAFDDVNHQLYVGGNFNDGIEEYALMGKYNIKNKEFYDITTGLMGNIGLEVKSIALDPISEVPYIVGNLVSITSAFGRSFFIYDVQQTGRIHLPINMWSSIQDIYIKKPGVQGNIVINPTTNSIYIGTFPNLSYDETPYSSINGDTVLKYVPKKLSAQVLPNTQFNDSAKLAIGNFINITRKN